MRSSKIGLTVYLFDLVGFQKPGDAACQLLGNRILVSDDLRKIHPHVRCLDADLLPLLHKGGDQFGTVQQALCGDTAYVQTCSAEILFFHQHHIRAQLRGANRGNITAGAAADNCNFHDLYSSILKPGSSPDAQYNTGCP